MKYLLFISFNSGLLHNAIYNTLHAAAESIAQLVKEEGSEHKDGKLPNSRRLKNHLKKEDDFTGYLANGTWYHVQSHPVFAI